MAADLLLTLAVSIGLNIALFFVAYSYKTDRLADISYALSFILLAWYGLLAGGASASAPKWVLVGMVTLWAARLGGFLLIRIWRTKRDKRFDGMRESFWKFGKFWLSQGISVWVILVPALLVLLAGNARFTPLSAIGLVVWAVGLLTEAVADLQKYRFSRLPANKDRWIDEGLWSYSRHPNYFGEITVWVGVYLFAFSSLDGAGRVAGLISPLFIITLLLFISGLPPLEKSADARWGNLKAYQLYKRRTSVLIPLPHKNA